MTFLPHSSRGRHAVDEEPADAGRTGDGEPATEAPGDEAGVPPAGGQAPEPPRYAFGYAPHDAGGDEGGDAGTGASVVRGDVVDEDGDVVDEDGDYPPVTVADIPAMAGDQGAATAGSPVPAPRAAPGYEPAAQETAAQETAAQETAAQETGAADAGIGEPLLAGQAALRARWQRAQSDFVDDPRAAVTDAAALVEQAAQAIIDTLELRKRQLRQQWERGQAGDPGAPAGEPSDTERLRLTMRRYRALFDQLCER